MAKYLVYSPGKDLKSLKVADLKELQEFFAGSIENDDVNEELKDHVLTQFPWPLGQLIREDVYDLRLRKSDYQTRELFRASLLASPDLGEIQQEFFSNIYYTSRLNDNAYIKDYDYSGAINIPCRSIILGEPTEFVLAIRVHRTHGASSGDLDIDMHVNSLGVHNEKEFFGKPLQRDISLGRAFLGAMFKTLADRKTIAFISEDECTVRRVRWHQSIGHRALLLGALEHVMKNQLDVDVSRGHLRECIGPLLAHRNLAVRSIALYLERLYEVYTQAV